MKAQKQTGAAGTAGLHEPLLDDDAVARLFGIATNTLAKWRCRGHGPRFIKVGSAVRYRLADIEEYLRRRTVEPGAVEAR